MLHVYRQTKILSAEMRQYMILPVCCDKYGIKLNVMSCRFMHLWHVSLWFRIKFKKQIIKFIIVFLCKI